MAGSRPPRRARWRARARLGVLDGGLAPASVLVFLWQLDVGRINKHKIKFQSLTFLELPRQAEGVGKRRAAPLQIADARRTRPLDLERPS